MRPQLWLKGDIINGVLLNFFYRIDNFNSGELKTRKEGNLMWRNLCVIKYNCPLFSSNKKLGQGFGFSSPGFRFKPLSHAFFLMKAFTFLFQCE